MQNKIYRFLLGFEEIDILHKFFIGLCYINQIKSILKFNCFYTVIYDLSRSKLFLYQFEFIGLYTVSISYKKTFKLLHY